MTFERTGRIGLDYDICEYDGSRLQFRGPKADLSNGYVAFMGATETFGKYLTHPFPILLADHLPIGTVNLGMINGGVDAYLADPVILKIAKDADLRVVQVFGALNQSNHYYKVHPRRNDRFIGATETLIQLFPEVDFAEFHFTRAMLSALHQRAHSRYKMLCDELQNTWLTRMKALLDTIGGPTLVLWFADRKPLANATLLPNDPMLVDQSMLRKLRERADCYVELVPGHKTLNADRMEMLQVMASPAAARWMLGPQAHAQVAQALQEPCLHLLK